MNRIGTFRVTDEGESVAQIRARPEGPHGELRVWENDEGYTVYAMIDQGEYRAFIYPPERDHRYYRNTSTKAETIQWARNALKLVTSGDNPTDNGFDRIG